MIRVGYSADPNLFLLEIKDASDKEFHEEFQFIKGLPGARFYRESKQWTVSPEALPLLWTKFGLQRCDWLFGPWQVGLMEEPAPPPEIVPTNEDRDLFRGEIKEFQSLSSSYLLHMRRAILGDDVGLGKTISAIRAFLKGLIAMELGRALVITRASLKRQWQSEIEGLTWLDAVVIDGGRKRRMRLWEEARERYTFVVANYDQLILPEDFEQMKALGAHVLIADEAHYLKNLGAKRTKAALELIREIPYFWALTATPTTGKLEEIWTLFQFIDPSILGKISHFARDYCTMAFRKTGKGKRFAGYKTYRNKPVLRAKVRPYILMRKAHHIGEELPKVIPLVRRVEPTKAQKTIFDRIQAEIKKLESEMQMTRDPKKIEQLEAARTGCLSLFIMAADDPELLERSDSTMAKRFIKDLPKGSGSPKLDELVLEAQEWVNAGHSFIVFTSFVHMADKIAHALSGLKADLMELDEPVEVPVHIVTGETNQALREAIKQEFQSSKTPQIVVMDAAGQEGLNFQRGSIVVLFDTPWNVTDVQQRLGRIRRIGSQHESICLVQFFVEDSIEENILELHKKRLDNIQGIVPGG